MKRIYIILLVVLIAGAGTYIYLVKNGYSDLSIINKPLYYDLSVTCSDVNDLIVSSEVDVTVSSSDRSHDNVTVLLTAYDNGNNIVKQKRTTFERTLPGHESLSKPVMLPAKAKRCDCVIESSNPVQ